MLIQKKEEIAKEEANPYDWPESYYMEIDADRRKQLLEAQMHRKPGQKSDELRMELWQMRYVPVKKENKYKDIFMGALVELMWLCTDVQKPFSARRVAKQAGVIRNNLGLVKEDHFSRELLLEEMKHLFLVYAVTCMEDKQYQNVIFGFGRLKKEKIEQKLTNEILRVSSWLPAELKMEAEFRIFTEGAGMALRHLGLAPQNTDTR